MADGKWRGEKCVMTWNLTRSNTFLPIWVYMFWCYVRRKRKQHKANNKITCMEETRHEGPIILLRSFCIVFATCRAHGWGMVRVKPGLNGSWIHFISILFHGANILISTYNVIISKEKHLLSHPFFPALAVSQIDF